ncbi:MAG: outer membrane beta-barrel protein [Saprospiraceae bacterium]
MYSLFGRKIVLFVLLTSWYTWSIGQSQDKYEGNNFRQFAGKNYYFGLAISFNQSTYKLYRSNYFIKQDSLLVTESIKNPGFSVGIIANVKFGDHFDFRFVPTFSFANRNIRYNDRVSEVDRRIESTFLELPMHVRFTSLPYKDMKVFIVGGLKYSYDISNKSRTKKFSSLIKLSPHDFAAEVGAGMQFFFPYFIFSPEIKFSQGIGNILIYNGSNSESSVLEKILSRAFTITLNFEG